MNSKIPNCYLNPFFMKRSVRFSKHNTFKYILRFLKTHSLLPRHRGLKTSHFQKLICICKWFCSDDQGQQIQWSRLLGGRGKVRNGHWHVTSLLRKREPRGEIQSLRSLNCLREDNSSGCWAIGYGLPYKQQSSLFCLQTEVSRK